MGQKNEKMPAAGEAPPGTDAPLQVSDTHYVLRGNRTVAPFPKNLESCVFGTGCFWGTEKGFWRMPGVYSTSTGYAGGFTKNPTYRQVCSGATGHNEVVQVVWDPAQISFADILRQFWESHDPSQGMGQGNDRGTQYRSGIYPQTEAQKTVAEKSRAAYQAVLSETGKQITTEIVEAGATTFYYAEDYHQQYLAKPGANPYCSAQPLCVSLPPISEWCPESGLENKLPDAYWAKFAPTPHCVLRQPNSQISLSSL